MQQWGWGDLPSIQSPGSYSLQGALLEVSLVLYCRVGCNGAGGRSAPPTPEMWVCLSVLGILETAPAELNFRVRQDLWSPYCLQGSVPASETQKPHPGVLQGADEEEG